MMRGFLIIITALSTLKCIAMTALWLTGYLLGWEGVYEHMDGDRLGYSR